MRFWSAKKKKLAPSLSPSIPFILSRLLSPSQDVDLILYPSSTLFHRTQTPIRPESAPSFISRSRLSRAFPEKRTHNSKNTFSPAQRNRVSESNDRSSRMETQVHFCRIKYPLWRVLYVLYNLFQPTILNVIYWPFVWRPLHRRWCSNTSSLHLHV